MNTQREVNSDIFPYDIEVIATNLLVPWAIAISEEGKLYVTERSGSIWILDNGRFLSEPLIRFAFPFISQGEGGLMGIALDPDFTNNRFIYVMHTYYDDGRLYNRVVRLVEENDKAVVDRVLIDHIPGSSVHNGGRIKIGPDQKLYIATGDAGEGELAQDLNSPAGKILRINTDGSIPEDNPFKNSPVYTLGHRNPQGLAWSPDNELYATEHGPMAHDEINRILPGRNYGWPIVKGDEITNQIEVEIPLVHSGDVTWAPSGLAFIEDGVWNNRLMAGGLRGEELILLTLNNDGTKMENIELWLKNSFGRFREVLSTSDGTIYLTTSNQDGRGNPDNTDDKIIRLIPRRNA